MSQPMPSRRELRARPHLAAANNRSSELQVDVSRSDIFPACRIIHLTDKTTGCTIDTFIATEPLVADEERVVTPLFLPIRAPRGEQGLRSPWQKGD